MAQSPDERFSELIRLPDEQIDLIEAALVIAAESYPGLDIEHYLQKFNVIVQNAKTYLKAAQSGKEHAAQLCDFLFVQQGFIGSQKDYYDPRNSFLNEVLDRRVGIPITLALLYIGVARNCGWEMYGINFPGHFLTKYVGQEGEIIIDPFAGKIMDRSECQIRYQAIMGNQEIVGEHYLQKAKSKEILIRMLRNLKNIYLKKEEWEAALSCCHRILLIAPDSLIELRNRGLLYFHLECFQEAQEDLERLLLIAPAKAGKEEIQYILSKIQQSARQIN